MNRNATRNLLLIAAMALAGLMVVQVFWLKQAFDLQQRQFADKANIALRNVGHQLLLLEGDSSSAIPPILPLSSNSFRMALQGSFNYDTLPLLLNRQLEQLGILDNYYLTIEECKSRELILGFSYQATGPQENPACSNRELVMSCADIQLSFTDQQSFLSNGMSIWIFSTVAFILVLLYFVYSLRLMLREKRLSRIRADMVNNMTHELKTPIANIAVASEVLKDKALSADKTKRYASIIQAENKRLQEQVERVLQLSLLESGQLQLEKEEINLDELIEEVTDRFAIRLEAQQGRIRYLKNVAAPMVEGDRFHLTNVVYSLLDNAEKYSPQFPDITISTEATPQGILVTVADKGVGIAKEAQQHIFDKFYRVPAGDQHNVKGFGLGLTYVKLIIEAHGGRMAVDSQINRGSRFSFSL